MAPPDPAAIDPADNQNRDAPETPEQPDVSTLPEDLSMAPDVDGELRLGRARARFSYSGEHKLPESTFEATVMKED